MIFFTPALSQHRKEENRKMNKSRLRFAAMFLLAPLLVVAALPARAADFSGETVQWIVPFKQGGGTDRWARFFAPLLSRHLPGNPRVIVKNIPGGGSVVGANQFARRAKPDGLTIFGSSSSTLFPYMLGDPRVEYNIEDWTVVLVSPTGGVVYLSPYLGVRSMETMDALKRERLTFGSQGATSLDIILLLGMDLLEFPLRSVFGLKGRGAGRLAFERGETNIDYQTSSAYIKNVAPMVKKGKASPLMSWGALGRGGKIFRDPTFSKVPHFTEIYEERGGNLKSPGYLAWKALFAAGYPAQKMVFLPKDTPEDIAAAYHSAFAEITSAADFREKSRAILGKYTQAIGEDAEKRKDLATQMDPTARRWVREWLRKKYGVEF